MSEPCDVGDHRALWHPLLARYYASNVVLYQSYCRRCGHLVEAEHRGQWRLHTFLIQEPP